MYRIGCKNKQNLLLRKIFAQNLAYVGKNVYLCSVLDKGVYYTLFWNMILNHLLTYNFLMASAAAHVCMWRETSSQEVANQADKPTNRRQVLHALVALSYINNKLTNIY